MKIAYITQLGNILKTQSEAQKRRKKREKKPIKNKEPSTDCVSRDQKILSLMMGEVSLET